MIVFSSTKFIENIYYTFKDIAIFFPFFFIVAVVVMFLT